MSSLKGSYSGALPVNARVTVDYENGKVRFGYPRRASKRGSKVKSLVDLYVGLIMILGLPILIMTAILFPAPVVVPMGDGFDVVIGNIPFLAALIIPMIIVLILASSEARFVRWFPKLNAFIYRAMLTRQYRVIFRRTHGRRVEVPMFKNVVLNYAAVGDFGKHLRRIEIREHPFMEKVIKGWRRNDSLWKATFLFKEDCRRGYLKVSFI